MFQVRGSVAPFNIRDVMIRFEYEDLVNSFEHSLLTELRGHGSGSDFLRIWVPDPDLTKSLTNMADAAEIENVAAFEVGIAAAHRADLDVATLTRSLAGTYAVTSTEGATGGIVLQFNREGAR
jgi:hypothetical protein